MADNKTGLNSQYDNAGAMFSGGPAYENTGFPGSPGIVDSAPGVGGSGVIANPVVSAPFGSSQLDMNMPRIPVTAGDTAAMTDDMGAHTSALLPGPLDGYLDTGAGHGTAVSPHHPNAGGGQ